MNRKQLAVAWIVCVVAVVIMSIIILPRELSHNSFIVDLREGTMRGVKMGPSMTPSEAVRLMNKKPEEGDDEQGIYSYYSEGIDLLFTSKSGCYSIDIHLNDKKVRGGKYGERMLSYRAFKGSLAPVILASYDAKKVIELLGEPNDSDSYFDQGWHRCKRLTYDVSYGYFYVWFDKNGKADLITLTYSPDPNGLVKKYLQKNKNQHR
jgi:hypothetical protein